MTKEKYLESYKTFILDVKDHYKEFNTEDWKSKDTEYKEFSETLYDKFHDRLSNDELLKVKRFSVQYRLYRFAGGFEYSLNSFYGEGQCNTVKEIMSLFQEASNISMDLSQEIENKVISKMREDCKRFQHEDGQK